MGLFADIARFRKPDAEEVTMEGNGKASGSGANGSEEGASGEKENSSALDNVGKFARLCGVSCSDVSRAHRKVNPCSKTNCGDFCFSLSHLFFII